MAGSVGAQAVVSRRQCCLASLGLLGTRALFRDQAEWVRRKVAQTDRWEHAHCRLAS